VRPRWLRLRHGSSAFRVAGDSGGVESLIPAVTVDKDSACPFERFFHFPEDNNVEEQEIVVPTSSETMACTRGFQMRMFPASRRRTTR